MVEKELIGEDGEILGKGVGEEAAGHAEDAGLSTKPRFRPGLHLLAAEPVDMGAVYKVLFKYY